MQAAQIKFAWRRVALIFFVIALPFFSAIAFPAIKADSARVRAGRLQSIYSTGLTRCQSNSSDPEFEELVQRYLPEKSALSIEQWPTLKNEANTVQIAGNHVYYLEFSPIYKKSKSFPRALDKDSVPKVTHANISLKTRQELLDVIANEIKHAQPDRDTTIDGVGYGFALSGVGCAYTNSPDSGSRAGQSTDLYFSLVSHASLKVPLEAQRSEQNIVAEVRAMQVQ